MQVDTNRPRILLVRFGGWQEWVHTVAEFLAHEGFDVHAACFRYGMEKTIEEVCRSGYRLVNITVSDSETAKATVVIRTARAMRRVLQSTPHDILYAFDACTLPSLWIASRGHFRPRGGRFVYQTFEWIEPGNNYLVHILLERAACRTADVVVNAERIRARLMQKMYGLSTLPVFVRPGLPLDFEVPARDDGLRKALLGSASDDAILLVCPSIVSRERRSFELIRAVSLLPEKYRLVTIARQGGYGETCRRLAEEIGVGQRVVFRPVMPFREVMAHISSGDVGIALHDGRGSVGDYLAAPMRLSQFAAAGIPCVASSLPSVEAVVYKHDLGVCCEDDSPQDIARAIRELCESGLGPRERGLRARQAFERELHFERGADKLVAALRRLL